MLYLEPTTPMSAMEPSPQSDRRGTVFLPASAQTAECRFDTADIHACTIIGDANRLHRTERILDDIDLDFARIGVERVPNQLLNGRQRRGVR